MKDPISNLNALKRLLEETAFAASSLEDSALIHRRLISALVLVEETENMLNTRNDSERLSIDEVTKVKRRLKLWSKRPQQLNTRILRTFLELERSKKNVTEAMLREKFNDESFDTNFVQMKNIAEKNHGKVFEQNGPIVTIWPPVEDAVREFLITVERNS